MNFWLENLIAEESMLYRNTYEVPEFAEDSLDHLVADMTVCPSDSTESDYIFRCKVGNQTLEYNTSIGRMSITKRSQNETRSKRSCSISMRPEVIHELREYASTKCKLNG